MQICTPYLPHISIMSATISSTTFHFPGQTGFYSGKVRDVYFFGSKMAMVATDRISAFDVILPRAIPQKGAILNQMAAHFLEATKDIVPNWLEASPDPNVAFGKVCDPIPIEMVVRGYLVGHAWREYKLGKRILCGEPMPDGLAEFSKFPEPIITPSTKAQKGHDEDISRTEILAQQFVTPEIYSKMEEYSLLLFDKGQEMAMDRGLILADTKYEFGLLNGEVVLMDEVHTPDSSRYYNWEGFDSKVAEGKSPEPLSKEFVRGWLMENGFMGKPGQQIPEMTDEFVKQVTDKYLYLFQRITGKTMELKFDPDIANRIEKNIFGILNR